MLALINATVLDGTCAAPRKGQKVLIDGKKIVGIGRFIIIPEGTPTIDLRGKILMPGLIEAHSHLGDHPFKDRPGIEGAKTTNNYEQMRKFTLEAGVTAIRSCGDYMEDTVALRDAVNAGTLKGPRVITSGKTFMRKDGHPATTVWAADPDTVENCGAYPGTAEEGRAMVRQAVEAGVDFIKLMISDIHISYWPKKGRQLDSDIIQAVIDEAHKYGRPVACHIDNLDQANLALDYEADEIHHLVASGSEPYELVEYEKLFIRMCEKNVWLVPTLAAPRAFEPMRITRGCMDGTIDYTLNVLRRAYEFGVPFGLGCDAGCPGVPWGKSIWEELSEYVYNIGMSPLEAIRCATYNNARIIGMETQLGSVRAGAYADLLVLEKDPLDDIGNIGSIWLVLRDGEIVVDYR